MINIINNLGNYSLHCFSTTKLDLTGNITFKDKYGCNGIIRTTRCKYLYIAIPKEEVDKTLNAIKIVAGIHYTFVDILDIFKEMSFNYEYIEKDEDIRFLNTKYRGYYVIEIKTESKKKDYRHRYYAFCMVRHFYYDQYKLIKYLKIHRFLKTDLEKILMLALIAVEGNSHSFVSNNIPLDDNLTFESLLESYRWFDNNAPTGFRYTNNYKLYFDYDIEDVLEIINNSIEKIKSTLFSYSHLNNYDNYNLKSICNIEKLNIDEEYFKKAMRLKSDKVLYKDDNYIIFSISWGELHGKKNLITIPINLNSKIKHNSLPGYNILKPKIAKYIVNLDKPSKQVVDNCIILNSYTSILNLKNRKFINTLCDQEEASNYPLLLKNKYKKLVETNIFVNSKDELKHYNLQKYVKYPIFKNYKTHHLYFTKDGLFLHQLESQDQVLDSFMTNFKESILNYNEIIKKCNEVFKNSQLDIGVITCNVCDDTNAIYITDISAYPIMSGNFVKTLYLQKINSMCST